MAGVSAVCGRWFPVFGLRALVAGFWFLAFGLRALALARSSDLVSGAELWHRVLIFGCGSSSS